MTEQPDKSVSDAAPPSTQWWKRRWFVRTVKILGGLTALWLISAYVVLPWLWRHYEHHAVMADAPKTTVTSLGIPGDPLNVGVIGTETQLIQALLDSGWHPADPITLRSSLKIAESVVLKRPYVDAPVSDLFVFGRKQDLAFEKPAGDDARQRHHVRFWHSEELGQNRVPLFLGAATFDMSVGLSHDTGQITHHIAPDVDAERDDVIDDLVKHHKIAKIYQVTGVGAMINGRNGGGDRYFTDGELTIGVLSDKPDGESAPITLANPPIVRWKDQFWSVVRPLLGASDNNGQDASE